MIQEFIKGLKFSLGFIFGLSLFLGIVFAIGFHSTEEILPGTFNGNYNFINGKIGIGIDSPSTKLHVSGPIQTSGINPYILLNNSAATTNEKYWLFTALSQGILRFQGLNDSLIGGGSVLDIGRRNSTGQNIDYFAFGGTKNTAKILFNVTSGNVGIGTNNPQAKLDINGTIKYNGFIIPEGFTETNGVIHTINMQSAKIHHDAVAVCIGLNSRICDGRDYRVAGLGWNDDTDYYNDDHLFWNGNTAWNGVMSCSGVSWTLGQTVEAGGHSGGNNYHNVDITACAERGTRNLPYYCCK